MLPSLPPILYMIYPDVNMVKLAIPVSGLENIAKKVPDYKTNDSFHFLFFLLTFPVDKPQCRTAESKCFPDFIFNIACV